MGTILGSHGTSGLNYLSCPQPQALCMCVCVLMFYLLNSCFARSRYIHWKVQLTRLHCYNGISLPLLILKTYHHSNIGEHFRAFRRSFLLTRRLHIPNNYCNSLASNNNSTILVPFHHITFT